MAVNLNSTSSIVDYLGTQNKDSSFAARKKLYNEMGLNERLGDYVGSPTQNTNFLNSLRTPTDKPAETPFYPTPTGAPTPIMTAKGAVNTASQPTSQATPAVNVASTPTAPPVQAPQPTTATEALDTFGYTPPKPMTPEEVVAGVEATPQFGLAQEERAATERQAIAKAETEKQALTQTAEENKEEITNTLATRGLASSSFMVEGIQKIADNLATSTLGVDRELAETLLATDRDARGKFLDLAADVVKGATEGNKTELEQLNKMGYAYVGGEVLPIPQKTDFTGIKSVQGGLYDLNSGQWIVQPKPGSDGGLTTYQQGQAFLRISDKYQADAIINTAVRGQTAVQIADQVLANPGSAANQLKSLYIIVKNLDPDSAVREGELALANQTQSYLDKFKTTIARITEGKVISSEAATALAEATKELAMAWNATAARRQQQYQSQADVAGVGDQFGGYLGGYESTFAGGGILTSPDGTEEVDISELSEEQIQEAKEAGWQ